MPFITDKQTLDDLNVLGKYKNNSVFNLFNRTKTAGAERLLEQMFQHPLTDMKLINERSDVIRYFQGKRLVFPLDVQLLQTAEQYLAGAAGSNMLMTTVQTGRRKALKLLGLTVEHTLVTNGLSATIQVLADIRTFVSRLLSEDPDGPFAAELNMAAESFNSGKLDWLPAAKAKVTLSFFETSRYDYLLRVALRNEMEIIMKLVHLTDLYISVSSVAQEKSFAYAEAVEETQDLLDINEGFHPCLNKAVPNSVKMDGNENVIFLTGANMAGKSTFMKSYGLCIYLAHMGFPVPAKSMVFSVKEGMYTSINVPDDINMGYSHFYAEVLRVKKIAEEVSAPKNLYIIFDELFKGTNVKDAYDATLAVSEVFATHRNCFFIISTHIVEVGEALAQRCDNIRFTYMPTEMRGKVPVYTYRAKEGISSDRHGMMIIENEKILEIIG
ncbi:putative mismatch repair-like protein [Pedobacter sp. BAL39]|uniref:MutS-related protein n=1 Tax=Pedobacter sp. BAL39 TaxID=391596 RepID=UPI000155A131|nr:mismatch repair-like protein [Pedobacter sp. BAL39]EDM36009.1 putative mismatch repair-like protein [Pedobacter sp. BAL39]